MPASTPAPSLDRNLTGRERRTLEWCWRPTGTNDWLLLYTLAGEAHVRHSAGELLVAPGAAVLFQPGATHHFGVGGGVEPWELVWAHFHPREHWLELLRWPRLEARTVWMRPPEGPLRARIERLLLDADQLATSGLLRADWLALSALEEAILWWDVRNPARDAPDPRIVEAIEYLSRKRGRDVSVDELARVVHLSPSHLARLFRRETGLTPLEFRERQRLERAKQLLELTSLPVYAVAREAGFRSQFYFATRFKKQTGLTPTAYRAQRRVAESLDRRPDMSMGRPLEG